MTTSRQRLRVTALWCLPLALIALTNLLWFRYETRDAERIVQTSLAQCAPGYQESDSLYAYYTHYEIDKPCSFYEAEHVAKRIKQIRSARWLVNDRTAAVATLYVLLSALVFVILQTRRRLKSHQAAIREVHGGHAPGLLGTAAHLIASKIGALAGVSAAAAEEYRRAFAEAKSASQKSRADRDS